MSWNETIHCFRLSTEQMTIYNFYLFDRTGCCICYREWKRDKESGLSKSEEFKLVYGMLLSLRSFAAKLSPRDSKQSLRSFQTSTYKLHYFETPTGLKLVMNTDKNAGAIHDLLRQIHSQVYVETVAKNPMVKRGVTIDSDLFYERLDDLVSKHSSFAS